MTDWKNDKITDGQLVDAVIGLLYGAFRGDERYIHFGRLDFIGEQRFLGSDAVAMSLIRLVPDYVDFRIQIDRSENCTSPVYMVSATDNVHFTVVTKPSVGRALVEAVARILMAVDGRWTTDNPKFCDHYIPRTSHANQD